MDSIFTILQKNLQKRGIGVFAQSSQITHVATKVIAELLPDVANMFSISTLHEKQLIVLVENSLALQEIHSHKDDILTEIQRLHPNSVESIIVKRK